MLTKGQTITLNITDMNHLGYGLGRADGMVVFVQGAVPLDKVRCVITEVKKNYATADTESIIDRSPHRIEPPCPFYHRCGGCQLMHVSYPYQLTYKRDRVINELRRAGVNTEEAVIHDTTGMDEPFRYRNKNVFFAGESSKGLILGLYQQGTYDVVPVDSCLLQSEAADRVLHIFRQAANEYGLVPYNRKTGKGTVKSLMMRVNREGNVMVVIVTANKRVPGLKEAALSMAAEMSSITTIVQNLNAGNNSQIMGSENIVLYGAGTITDTICGLKFSISPDTFFQINPLQTEKMYETAIKYADLNKSDICCDLYCGVGTISLLAAQHAGRVYGIEAVGQAVTNAQENSKRNNITNAEFIRGKAEEVLPKLYRQAIKPDVIILDPPRKGCEKSVTDTIKAMSPRQIVYVSCNPSTLARDIRQLEDGGYTLKAVQPVDNFLWSVHTECIAKMIKNDIQ